MLQHELPLFGRESERFDLPEIAVECGPRGWEAVFDLELAAVRIEANGSSADFLTPFLLGGTGAVEVVHRLDVSGFSCFLRGRARHEREERARSAAVELWAGLRLALGGESCHYDFSPAEEPRGEGAAPLDWRARARSSGLAIELPRSGAMGFAAPVSRPREALRLLMAGPSGLAAPWLDMASIGRSLTVPVEATVAVEAFALSPRGQELVDLALRRLLQGQPLHYESGRESHDPQLRERLVQELERWRREPRGFRVEHAVAAPERLPAGVLEAIADKLLPGDSVTWLASAAGPEPAPGPDTLDLRGVVHAKGTLPPLLPSPEAMLARGSAGPTYVFVPQGLPTSGVSLGVAGAMGSERTVFFAEEDRKRHLFVVGATGTGKSTLLHHMVMEDIEAGRGVCLIDPHGDLYQSVLGSMTSRFEDLVLIDASDSSRAVGLNLLELEGPTSERAREATFIGNEMLSMFDRLYNMDRTGGPVFELYMRNALSLVMDSRRRGGSLLDVPRLFEDADFREQLLEKCTNPYAVAFWVKQAQAAGGELSLPNVGPYITSKLNQLTHNALLRPIVGQARSSVRLATCMGLGQIVLINLAKGHLGDFSARLLGMIVLSKLFNAALARSTVEPHKRRPFFVYLDEAHSLATSTTAQMLAEARKFGLHLTLASQTLAHLEGRRDGKLREALLGNVGSLLLFRLGPPDARELAPYVEPRLKTRDLQDLPNFHAAARMLTYGRPTPPFVLRTAPPWPSAPASAAEGRRLAETLRHRYTRSVAEVEEELEAAMDAS